MGLSKYEIEHMRIGAYMDLFDNYKEIHNMEMQKGLYTIPDRLDRVTSMLDFD